MKRVTGRGLAAWGDLVESKEKSSPWPGPRPLDEGDIEEGRNLIGRDADLRRLCQRLESDYLVVLHGESGVGKSSFLQVGLAEGLPGANFEAYVLSEWPDVTQWSKQYSGDASKHSPRKSKSHKSIGATFDKYLVDQFQIQYPGMHPELKEQMDELGVAALLARIPGRPVLVLDQFEEFLRIANWAQLKDFEEWLLATNRDIKLRIVLSLRSELLYKLNSILGRVRSHSLSTLPLDSITSEDAIRDIVTKPSRSAEVTIDPEVVDLLVQSIARSTNIRDSFWLLRLQAVLYSLYWHCEGKPSSVTITKTQFVDWVKSCLKEGPRGAGSDNSASMPKALTNFLSGSEWTLDDPKDPDAATRVAQVLSTAGFVRAVELKLEHCQEVADLNENIPSKVINPLCRDQLRRMLPHLSTGTFKDRKSLLELFRDTYADELARLKSGGIDEGDLASALNSAKGEPIEGGLKVTDDTVKELFDNLWHLADGSDNNADLLSADRSKIIGGLAAVKAEEMSGQLRLLEKKRQQLQIDHLPWYEDPDDVSSGPLLGARPVEIITEMMRCFLFAAKWLERSLICRIAGGQIRLTHDGFGDALTNWASLGVHQAESEIAAFVSMVGERRRWGKGVSAFIGNPTRWLANLRWQSCQLENMVVRKVVFVNCDFRNTRFEKCRFDGVVFVNCQLDGTLFSSCTIIGGTSFEIVEKAVSPKMMPDIEKGGIPSFIAQDPPDDILNILKHFRHKFPLSEEESTSAEHTDLLFSATSGVGAMVVNRRPNNVEEIPKVEHGLVILGSRASGLMLRDVAFASLETSSEGATQEPKQTPTTHAGLILAYVAGSSIDFVEQNELSLGVIGCALRGLSISRPVSRGPGQFKEIDHDAFRMNVTGSLLVNTWFGDLLRGTIEMTKSTVFGLASLPHPSDLSITLEETCHAGLIDNVVSGVYETLKLGGESGWDTPTNRSLIEEGWPFTGREDYRLWRVDGLAEVSRKTDYRDRGAAHELDRRQRRITNAATEDAKDSDRPDPSDLDG